MLNNVSFQFPGKQFLETIFQPEEMPLHKDCDRDIVFNLSSWFSPSTRPPRHLFGFGGCLCKLVIAAAKGLTASVQPTSGEPWLCPVLPGWLTSLCQQPGCYNFQDSLPWSSNYIFSQLSCTNLHKVFQECRSYAAPNNFICQNTDSFCSNPEYDAHFCIIYIKYSLCNPKNRSIWT